MKKIGILGGMTFESTTTYYHRINRQVNQAMGGMHCAEMILYNLDFDFIIVCTPRIGSRSTSACWRQPKRCRRLGRTSW